MKLVVMINIYDTSKYSSSFSFTQRSILFSSAVAHLKSWTLYKNKNKYTLKNPLFNVQTFRNTHALTYNIQSTNIIITNYIKNEFHNSYNYWLPLATKDMKLGHKRY